MERTQREICLSLHNLTAVHILVAVLAASLLIPWVASSAGTPLGSWQLRASS